LEGLRREIGFPLMGEFPNSFFKGVIRNSLKGFNFLIYFPGRIFLPFCGTGYNSDLGGMKGWKRVGGPPPFGKILFL